MKADPLGWREAQAGKVLACFFSKPSTRTRVSLEAAAQRLGMLPLMLRPDELQAGARRADLGHGPRAVGLRGRHHDPHVRAVGRGRAADAASVPVINALTDDHHPCQALADLLTIQERFETSRACALPTSGTAITSPTTMEAGALAGMEVVVSTYGYGPHAEIQVATHATRSSIQPWAVRGAQIVYTDVWVSMGQDAERAERLAALAPYQVSTAIMDAAQGRDYALPAGAPR